MIDIPLGACYNILAVIIKSQNKEEYPSLTHSVKYYLQ